MQRSDCAHTRSVPSPDAEARREPSGEYATESTGDPVDLDRGMLAGVAPASVATSAPVAASHTRTVLSNDAEASHKPLGEYATDSTDLVWPASVATTAPVDASHSRTV